MNALFEVLAVINRYRNRDKYITLSTDGTTVTLRFPYGTERVYPNPTAALHGLMLTYQIGE